MRKGKVEVNGKEYIVDIAETQDERCTGLQNVEALDQDKGMLFVYNYPDTIGMWMADTKIPLDIIFINEDEEVISIFEGQPNDRTIAEEDDVKYVLEVNQGSGIKEGDEVDIEEEEDDSETSKMLVIGPDGGVQMELEGGERIVSRRETKILVKKAKKAYNSELDSDYKSLGKYMFKVLNKQDKREPEYVEQK